MSDTKIGLWLVGAWGGVATTVAVGLAALQEGLTPEFGLVSALPKFQELDLIDWDQLVIGGHEIRDLSYGQAASQLNGRSGVFSTELLDAIASRLAVFDDNVRPGTLINVGKTISSLAGRRTKSLDKERPVAAIERISTDLNEFRERHELDHVIVMNLASTEPSLDDKVGSLSWQELSKKLENARTSPLPASSIYAVAAMLSECSYVNFTPSSGSNLPVLEELALQQGVLHYGRDGKTGETLMKSVLAPMFANRNLKVLSWVGHNIFGNLDGKVLDDPVNKANKVRSKDHLLTEILGYKPQTLVSIEYIESMGDWKTAWDHIHFQGFLNTKMMLQFTWQGCDSLLAAPLVLDLVRFTEREWRQGKSGLMTHLASFFKSPMGTVVPEFGRQFQLLEAWANGVIDGKNV